MAQDQPQRFMPMLPAIRFENLRLALGPDTRVLMPSISFKGGGVVTLNGPLDPSLQARGLIRLNSGRIWIPPLAPLRLDPQEENVAVFTPSLGLVPYVDIAMQARVSDTVSAGTSDQITSKSICFEWHWQRSRRGWSASAGEGHGPGHRPG